jgi:hypothetical protein
MGGGLELMRFGSLPVHPEMEQEAQAVILEIGESSFDSFELLDAQGRGLSGTVGSAGVVMVEDLGPPAAGA